MDTRHIVAVVVVGAGLLVGRASAAPPAAADMARMARAESCPAVFGDSQVHNANASRRQGELDWVEEDDTGVTIVHGNQRWDDPFRLSIRGVRLVRVSEGSAVFELTAQVADRVKCRPGQYTLRVDDRVSRRTRILALLRHGVLVEHRGRLAFVSSASVASPRWLVAWRMPGEIPSDQSEMSIRSSIY